MSLQIIRCIVLTCTLLACSIAAGTDQTILTLQTATELALTGNPGLGEIRARAEAMAAIPSQAGSLPDPTVSFELQNLPTRSFDLRKEDGPTVWPILLACAGGDESVASCACLLLERVNTPRGGFFLPWARRKSDRVLAIALRSALEGLCACGAVLRDPEDETYCDSCQAGQAIAQHEDKMEERP